MKVSGVERSTEAEDTESDDLGGKEVLVGNISGESVVNDVLEVDGSDLLGGPEGPGGTEGGSSEEGHCE